MFTVEFEQTISKVVSLDDTGLHDDVVVTLCDDDSVHISQYCEEFGEEQVILLSYQQLRDILHSLDCKEGAYREHAL
jgi:hypothetical protein